MATKQSAKRLKRDIEAENNSSPIEAVLDCKYTCSIQLDRVFVSEIQNKKLASKVVKELSTKLPFSEWQHLKRVKSVNQEGSQKLFVFICPVTEITDASALETCDTQLIYDYMSKKGLDSTLFGTPHIEYVSRHAPLTRNQFEQCSKYWPCTFHEDKLITRKLNGQMFTQAETDIILNNMAACLALAKLNQKDGGVQKAACVVDPEGNRLLAKAVDMRHKHPLQHVTMVAIDLVARCQGGGAWQNLKGSLEPMSPDYDLNCGENSRENKSGPYLCTNYDMYITHEPCAMCAMALVHSRIGRVFYGCQQKDGALGTLYKIHCKKDINHHFEVYRGVMKEECTLLTNVLTTVFSDK